MLSDHKVFYRRRLPHYQPPNETFHVTFRLFGSLPMEAYKRLKNEQADIQKRLKGVENSEERRRLQRDWSPKYFVKIDELLDLVANGPTWLAQDRIASVVADAIKAQDPIEYDLLAYTIMSNHVHLLARVEGSIGKREGIVGRASPRQIMLDDEHQAAADCQRTEVRSTTAPYLLTDVMRRLKGSTAFECNQVLGRRGAFWQHESYDHVIRDDGEMDRTILYILENPVKAGLCANWRDWKWSYVKEGLIER